MFESLFGGPEISFLVRFVVALVVVVGLIFAFTWAVRRFGSERLGGTAARGRQPRLAVIDAAAVDGRRRLILIRRDNVEHLLMIGGPSDVVIEPNIVRAAAATREQTPPARAAAADTLPRAAPLDTVGNWPLQPEPAASPRLQRTPPAEEPASWPAEPELPPAPPPPQRRQARAADPLAGLAAELTRGGESRVPMPGEFGSGGLVLPREPLREREPPRQRESAREREPQIDREHMRERETAREPVVREREATREQRELVREREPAREREAPRLREPQPPPASAPAPVEEEFDADADQNLADMAQRLEAALRRPAKGGETRPPAENAPRVAAVNAEPAPPPSPRAPAPDTNPQRTDVKPARSLYDSLEKEMANLLGRPGGKS
jgi:flagellar protein FliO/FliZ